MEKNCALEKNKLIAVADALTLEGDGVVHSLPGKTIFCKSLLPGEKAEIEIVSEKKNYRVAKLVRVMTPSSARVAPECPVFSKCGGCSLLHLSYEAQKAQKKEHIQSCLQRIGGFSEKDTTRWIRDTIGMKNPRRYRNHVQYQVRKASGNSCQIGFFEENSHNIVEIKDCLLTPSAGAKLCAAIKEFCQAHAISAYDEKEENGLLRKISFRFGFNTGEIMIILELSEEEKEVFSGLLEYLQTSIRGEKIGDRLWEIKSVWGSVLPSVSARRKTKGKFFHLSGEKNIFEKIGDKKFRISPSAFFQVNSEQTKTLYDTISDFAVGENKENPIHSLLDLYCGSGTIGIYLSKYTKALLGVEINPASIKDALENARINQVTNFQFIEGKAELLEKEQLAEMPDCVILDPPRKGCDKKLLDMVISLLPKKLIYTSCDPATLARDLKILVEGGFSIEAVQPVDMFPGTGHIECVVLMSRKDRGREGQMY